MSDNGTESNTYVVCTVRIVGSIYFISFSLLFNTQLKMEMYDTIIKMNFIFK